MQIDWDKTLNELLADKVACRRCGVLSHTAAVAFSRAPEMVEYAPRCDFCTQKEGCEARKLLVLCEGCARELRLRVHPVDSYGLMSMLMNECRRDLEECLEYLGEYWREDLDLPPEEMDRRFEEVDPEGFEEEDRWRHRLEEEYLGYHRWFREHGFQVPDPGWRSEYAEEVLALGYSTLLGD